MEKKGDRKFFAGKEQFPYAVETVGNVVTDVDNTSIFDKKQTRCYATADWAAPIHDDSQSIIKSLIHFNSEKKSEQYDANDNQLTKCEKYNTPEKPPESRANMESVEIVPESDENVVQEGFKNIAHNEPPSFRKPDNTSSHDEVKPNLSYIALIAKAILESSPKRLSLGSIYDWIEKNYPYYKGRGQGWRNSVRHNLSLNDCFVKAGRCEDGKGNYWAIHPGNISDFMRGDFRQRRNSRRRGRKKDCAFDLYDFPIGYVSPGMSAYATPNFAPMYSPYTDAERRAYRLDEAIMRQNLNNPFVKWYQGGVGYTNASFNSGIYGGSSAQWPNYGETQLQGLYPIDHSFSR